MVNLDGMMKMVVILPIALFVGAALIPTALDQWNSADTSSYSSTQAAIYPLVAGIALVALLIAFVRPALDGM